MCNLNEVEFYDDEIDRWAASREFELRSSSYEFARDGLRGALERALRGFERLRESLIGLDAIERERAARQFRCEDPESAWIEMLREETT